MWEVQDVTGWEIVSSDPRGKREKRWLRAPHAVGDAPLNTLWLWKLPRERSAAVEPAIEIVALRLARACGLPAAEAVAGTSSSGAKEQRGILVRRFPHDGSGEVATGSAFLRGIDSGYSPSDYPNHTLARVRATLAAQPEADRLLLALARLLCFDAWIGNSDRHQGNWSVIRAPGRAELAPMYDPAACLGVELQPGHPLLDVGRRSAKDIERYATQCRSGFGDGLKLINMTAVVAELKASWHEWREHAASWVARFEHVFARDFPTLSEEVPEDWWPKPWRELAAILLEHRLHWLKKEIHGD